MYIQILSIQYVIIDGVIKRMEKPGSEQYDAAHLHSHKSACQMQKNMIKNICKNFLHNEVKI